jgi:site-specific DNA recombinase
VRAGIYARISSDVSGTELGVGRQQDDCRAEAGRRGWDVVHAYVDNDISATKKTVRPEYQRMLADVQAGLINALVVWDIDRLTRTPRELEDVIDLADKFGLALANVSGDIDLSTSDGRMMARIKGTVARKEVEEMSKRLKRKFREKAERGEPHGYAPYGYRREPVLDDDGNPKGTFGRDVIVDAEAAVIREAARRILALDSLASIVKDFNERGIHGPKAPAWNTTILRQIMLRSSNAGLRQYQGQVLGKSTTAAIYPEETFNRLVALLKDPSRKTNHVGPTPKHLLSGIALCGLCGGEMRRAMGRTVTSKTTGNTKRQPPNYNCEACFKVRRKQESVDEVVTGLIVRRLSQPDAVQLFAASDSTAALEAESEIRAIDAKLDIVADQFADDILTAAQLKRITTRLRLERATADRRLKAAQPQTVLASLVGGNVAEKWASKPIGAQREAVRALMTITIMPAGSGRTFDPDKIVIKWLS